MVLSTASLDINTRSIFTHTVRGLKRGNTGFIQQTVFFESFH